MVMSDVQPGDPDSFASIYETWLATRNVENKLVGLYREAWNSGDRAEQYAVLDFILRHRETSALDLVADALGGDDAELALEAVGVAFCLIADAVDVGSIVKAKLEDVRTRFPQWSPVIDDALVLVEKREQ